MEIPAPDRASRAELRRLVFGLRSGERRRIFPTRVHVGDPEGRQEEYADCGTLDAALRADVLHRLLVGLEDPDDPEDPDDLGDLGDVDNRGGRPVAMWLTRVGWPEPHDTDRLWLATGLQVFRERAQQPRWIAVVTKNGWYNAVGGDRVVWKRLRIR